MPVTNTLTTNAKFKGLKAKVYQGDVDQQRFNKQMIYFVEQLAKQNAELASVAYQQSIMMQRMMNNEQEEEKVDNSGEN